MHLKIMPYVQQCITICHTSIGHETTFSVKPPTINAKGRFENAFLFKAKNREIDYNLYTFN